MKKQCRFLVIFPILVLAGFTTYASDTRTEEIVAKLRWLNDADAAEMFARDVQSGVLQFYAVYGAGRSIPGIGVMNYAKCYKKYVLLETIQGCDSCINLEHYYLNQDAWRFSRQYNALMRQYLLDHHLSDCSAECDWDRAWAQLTMFIRKHTKDKDWYFYPSVIVDEEENDVIIQLRNLGAVEVIKQEACQQHFASCGNNESISFSIREYQESRSEEPHIVSTFRCFQGKIIE